MKELATGLVVVGGLILLGSLGAYASIMVPLWFSKHKLQKTRKKAKTAPHHRAIATTVR